MVVLSQVNHAHNSSSMVGFMFRKTIHVPYRNITNLEVLA